ncbi:MAG: MaoC/PaaZ C-terminal domain-containing protein [Myxococcota bacterium]
MTIDPNSLGYETAPVDFEYGWRDTVTYALGVGATPPKDLDFLYEGRGPAVLPTFATIPTFSVFDDLVDRIGCDRLGMVHHSQRLDVMGALQPSGRLRVVGRVAGLYDLRRLAMSEFEIEAYDERGEQIARGIVTLVLRNDGGFGGPRPPKADRVHPPDRGPDFEVEDEIPASQALLYRLNGDLNPLHADPEFASQAGFDQPILHGLCTFGYAGRAVVHQVCGGNPAKVATIQGQFSAPVFPGDTLVTQGWNADDRVLLKLSTRQRPNESCLSQAYVALRD